MAAKFKGTYPMNEAYYYLTLMSRWESLYFVPMSSVTLNNPAMLCALENSRVLRRTL